MGATDCLYEPIQLGPKRAKNRIMRVATTANLADANKAGPRLLAFYRAVAKGGAGTIVTEAMRTQPQDPFGPAALTIFDRAAIPALRNLSDVCHAEGALLIGQLAMGGRQHLASRVMPFTTAPSAIACPRSGGVPHALSDLEVRETIEVFITCAVHCIEAGMDGVEVHGAQGHLIQQFVSPYTNRREDEWGGSFEKRLAFPRAILEGIRRRVGPRVIVGYRQGVEEFTQGGLTIDDTLEVGRALVQDGLVDYLSLAQGNFNSIETHLPDRHTPILGYRHLHKRFKEVSGDVPVIATTRIQTPSQGAEMIAAGEADMIGLCRALIVDPDWPNKGLRGQEDEIRKCIACNQCWAWIAEGQPIACATNPMAGREYVHPPLSRDRAEESRRVLVVGGGPAGLEATRVAEARGHDVTLIEASERLGGRLRDIHTVPNHEEIGNLLEFLVPAVERSGAEIRLDATATVETILSEGVDHIVIAAGSEAMVPPVQSDGSVPVHTSDGILPEIDVSGRHVLIMDEDGYYWTSAVVEAVIAKGGLPIAVSRVFEVCRELPMVSRIEFHRHLDQNGGRPVANTEIARVEDGGVVLRQYQTGRETRIDDVAAVFWTGASAPRSQLHDALRLAGIEKHRLHLVGDAFAPRRLVHALTEAHDAARRIGSPVRN